jgi:hypothetical protein
VQAIGTGYTGMGILISRATGATLQNCDVVGWDEGMRLSGNVNWSGNRLEVNHIGAVLGKDKDGANFNWAGLGSANSFEANDVGWYAFATTNGALINCGVLGGQIAAPSGKSKIGYEIQSAQQLVVIACSVTGYFTTAGIIIEGFKQKGMMIFCEAYNSEPGAKVWDVRESVSAEHESLGSGDFEFIGCNYKPRPDWQTAFWSLRNHGMVQYLGQVDYLNPMSVGKNLRGTNVCAAGAAFANVTFTAQIVAAGTQLNSVTATAGAGLADGTYYYVQTIVTMHGEVSSGSSYEKTVVCGGGNNQVTVVFNGSGGVLGYKRRVYRGTTPGTYDGYYEMPLNSDVAFVDIGGAFTEARSAPRTGVNASSMIEPDANYQVWLTPTWNTTWWITNVATTGFTANFGIAPGSNSNFGWLIVR